eukprot:14900756-Alexandrium_andersonii.AAC.1
MVTRETFRSHDHCWRVSSCGALPQPVAAAKGLGVRADDAGEVVDGDAGTFLSHGADVKECDDDGGGCGG